MRQYGNHDEVIQAYFNNEPGPHNAKTLFFEGDILYSYGHHFPLAIRLPGGFYLLNGDGYSVTTRCHQSKVQSAAPAGNYATISLSAVLAAADTKKGHLEPKKDIKVLDYKEDTRLNAGIDFPADNIPKIAGGTSFFKWDNELQKNVINFIHKPGGVLLQLNIMGYSKTDSYKRIIKSHVYVICGMDDGSYFVTVLPKKANTIPAAFELLKPAEIRLQEDNGVQVVRQGEWFFYPVLTGKPAKNIYKTMQSKFVLPKEDRFSNSHTATRGMIKNRQIFCSGNIRHTEHPRLKLSYAAAPIIFRAIPNTGKFSFSSTGVD